MVKRDDRVHARHDLEFKVEYSVISGFENIKLIETRTLDFSLSGARIETNEELKTSDQLSVRIEFPDLNVFELDEHGNKKYGKTALMCFGKVCWVGTLEHGGYHAGVRFSGISVADRAYLKRLLDEGLLEQNE